MKHINCIESARQHILNVWTGKDLLESAVDSYYPQFKNNPRLREFYKAKIKKNPGWLGNYLEWDVFDRPHDIKAERDINCAELKTMQLSLNTSGKSFSMRSLGITKANRADLIDNEFTEHAPLQSKFLDMIVVFCHNNRLLQVGIIQPQDSVLDQARDDYDLLSRYANDCETDHHFNTQRWNTKKDSVLTLSGKTINEKRCKAFAFSPSVIRHCFHENSISA
jgi:hypothetical protein